MDDTENSLIIDGREIKVLKERDPAALPWGDLGVDIVLESTGIFTDATKAGGHLAALPQHAAGRPGHPRADGVREQPVGV